MKRSFFSLLLVMALVFVFSGKQVSACTNYLITKGASVDGSTMISYAADSHVFTASCIIGLLVNMQKEP